MQPEPTEAIQKTSPDSTKKTYQPSQHGFSDCHDPPDSYPRRGNRGSGSQPAKAAVAAPGHAVSEASEHDLDESERRLSSASSRSSKRTGSPVDRIIEHEEALVTPPRRNDQGPGFTVIHRQGSSSGRLNLADFPNEVLTHILSHLPASTLSEVSLVSHRFHGLVTSPHAWRIAFSRHFSAQKALTLFDQGLAVQEADPDTLRSERRIFTRLTALASWRSEYIMRTQLLRSLSRGKPAIMHEVPGSSNFRSSSNYTGNAQITYNSNLISTVNHLDASFCTSLNKRSPNFIHGADEVGSACLSDPRTGKVDQWGFNDPQMFVQFVDDLPGIPLYGLGPFQEIGVPNAMDVSRQYGMIYAEGIPGGKVYYRCIEEKRGRLLVGSPYGHWPERGIPDLFRSPIFAETPCSVWVAKNAGVPDCSEGLVGILVGSSKGIVTAYSVGTSGLGEHRIERGEVTCRWVLSPGVPIIALSVDDNITVKKLASHRIWAVALNALGEIYYLTEMPTRSVIDPKRRIDEVYMEHVAWESARTVHWAVVEPSRRIARLDPFGSSDFDGSYSPRGSWNGMGLSPEQLAAETREIEKFLRYSPQHFRTANEGWDMRRRLEVDFAGDDGSGAGENVIVVQCGLDEGQIASIKRFTRSKVPIPVEDCTSDAPSPGSRSSTETRKASLFGTTQYGSPEEPSWSFDSVRRSSSTYSTRQDDTAKVEEWRTSNFTLGGLKAPQIMTTAIDLSTYALLTISEDPLLCIGGSSVASSPTSSPLPQMPRPGTPSDVPGQRARLLAAGTKTGTILLWNMRDPISSNTIIETTVKPVRIIYTESPQISCLALSALYLVHGGNDGLVQAWDPLASTTEPIRTINSRFSSRARRRLVQAEASPHGVGINLFAAGAIFLDPDPTALRGMVSLGTHLRYWSYSSSAADKYKGTKRRLRRSGGRRSSSNQGNSSDIRFSGTGRGALKDYIANEKLELEREKAKKRKEEERMAGRFGLDLLGPGATEDEILAYATLLSQEAAESDEQRRKSESSSGNATPTTREGPYTGGVPAEQMVEIEEDATDPDIAEAIRLSLQDSSPERADRAVGVESSSTSSGVPIRFRKGKQAPSSSPPMRYESPTAKEQEELDFALRLSLAEEESRDVSGKGKGKGREEGE